MMNSLQDLATRHLLLRLRPMNRALAIAIEKQKASAAQVAGADVASLCLTDGHVKAILQQVQHSQSSETKSSACDLDGSERLAEQKLREQAREAGWACPLDQLSKELGLSRFEQEALLLCAAPEIDSKYERIFGYILDDLNRHLPSVELLVGLTVESAQERAVRRLQLCSFSRLRRFRVLVPCGEAGTGLRQELRLGPGVFEYLTGAAPDFLRMFCDRDELSCVDNPPPPANVPLGQFTHIAEAIKDGSLAIVGIWGPRQNAVTEFARALATATQRSIRRLSVTNLTHPDAEPVELLKEQLRIASGLHALIWFDTDTFSHTQDGSLQDLVADVIADSPVPILLTGEQPWRRTLARGATGYFEITLTEPKLRDRQRLWSSSFPELNSAETADLARRLSLAGEDISSISQLARTSARIAGNGRPEPLNQHIQPACSVITRRVTSHFTTKINPSRGAGDLILRPDLHAQVIEIANFFRLRSQVDEEWGFGRLASGSGMKVLFAGEPGTGKTLAAEVIAGVLGISLHKVDIARVVSKWVGETEKNLDAAFREAEESQAALFFDECESYYGKRADIRQGTDRWANLEVSYLLQRLDAARGLVILASNVKDQLDPAFIRRFHAVIHFPKPGLDERRRMWELAFPKSAPVGLDVDLDALSRLDMTGAAIVTTARAAAMLAADAGASTITMANVVRSAARQFRREARVLTPSDLGSYGALLQGAP